MEINNPSPLRPPEEFQGNQNFVPKYSGKFQPSLKLVEQGYAD